MEGRSRRAVDVQNGRRFRYDGGAVVDCARREAEALVDGTKPTSDAQVRSNVGELGETWGPLQLSPPSQGMNRVVGIQRTAATTRILPVQRSLAPSVDSHRLRSSERVVRSLCSLNVSISPAALYHTSSQLNHPTDPDSSSSATTTIDLQRRQSTLSSSRKVGFDASFPPRQRLESRTGGSEQTTSMH